MRMRVRVRVRMRIPEHAHARVRCLMQNVMLTSRQAHANVPQKG